MSEFVVTREWIEAHCPGGAITNDQHEALGFGPLPTQGWKQRIIGQRISEEQRRRFELRRKSAFLRKETERTASLDLFT